MTAVLIKHCLAPEGKRRILFAAAASAECDAGYNSHARVGQETVSLDMLKSMQRSLLYNHVRERVIISWVHGSCLLLGLSSVIEKEPCAKA